MEEGGGKSAQKEYQNLQKNISSRLTLPYLDSGKWGGGGS